MDAEYRTRLDEFVKSVSKFTTPSGDLATSATLRQNEESFVNTALSEQSLPATKIATSATDEFESYTTYLQEWVDDGRTALPRPPSIHEPPRRAEAWSLWWKAVEGCRANKEWL